VILLQLRLHLPVRGRFVIFGLLSLFFPFFPVKPLIFFKRFRFDAARLPDLPFFFPFDCFLSRRLPASRSQMLLLACRRANYLRLPPPPSAAILPISNFCVRDITVLSRSILVEKGLHPHLSPQQDPGCDLRFINSLIHEAVI